VQLERHLNLPGVFAASLIPAAIIGTVIAMNRHNWEDNPAAHPYARLWWMSFVDATVMTVFLFIVASGIAVRLRMIAEGRSVCTRRDVRIFAQDLFIALVSVNFLSLVNTFVSWVYPNGTCVRGFVKAVAFSVERGTMVLEKLLCLERNIQFET